MKLTARGKGLAFALWASLSVWAGIISATWVVVK